MKLFSKADIKRFWKYVSTKPTPKGCLEWTGYTDYKGYAQIRIKGDVYYAHVVAWMLAHNRRVPKNYVIRHKLCRNPSCCNEKHLRSGTRVDDARDKLNDGMTPMGDKHWTHVHPEKVIKGDAHFARRHPELMARGKDNGAAKYPERISKGVRLAHKLNPNIAKNISIALKKMYKENPGKVEGSKNANAKLTEDSVKKIRTLYKSLKYTYKDLAKRFKVSNVLIGLIVRRKIWTHI